MIFLWLVPAILYASLISAYWKGWRAMPEAPVSDQFTPRTSISLIIPVRDDMAVLEACIQSVVGGNYPANLLEIIVVDDFSLQLSKSLKLLESSSYKINLLYLSDHLPPEARFTANKKKAIALGVRHASGELIVTTDADCLAPAEWLWRLAANYALQRPKLICGPVSIHREKNLLERFQSLDLLGMMGVSGAGTRMGWHYMANGANLAYPKEVFEAVNGYAGNEHLASGDDMFLAQKVAEKWPGEVLFLKDRQATVQTDAAPDWRAFWHQRLRWGTKNAAFPGWPLRFSLLTVFLFCWSIWLSSLLAISGVIPWQVPVVQWIVKAGFDWLFLSEMCRFFQRKDLLRWFLPAFFLHTAYIPVVGTAGFFIQKYEWKGRSTR